MRLLSLSVSHIKKKKQYSNSFYFVRIAFKAFQKVKMKMKMNETKKKKEEEKKKKRF